MDVESRNDISRSMARDSSSNKTFLVSFQMSFYSMYVLEAFLYHLYVYQSEWLCEMVTIIHVSYMYVYICSCTAVQYYVLVS